MRIKRAIKFVIVTAMWILAGVLIASAITALTGCKALDALRDDVNKPDVPDKPAVVVTPPDAPQPQPEPPAEPIAVTPEPIAGTPDPVPVVEPVPVAADSFIWEPRGDSVYVRIPSDLRVTQFTLVTLNPHEYIYGPNRANAHEYIIPGNAAHWIKTAMTAVGRPSIMVYVNTSHVTDTGHPSAGWRILDPSKRVEGDEGTRLLKGQNK